VALQKIRTGSNPLQDLRCIVLLVVVAFSLGTAQEVPPADSLGMLQPDTLRAARYKTHFISFVGSLEYSTDSTSMLHSTQFIQSDAASVADLFQRIVGGYVLDLGQPGQPSELSLNGLYERSTGFLLDGRPIRDPVTGRFNLYDIPLEYIDDIEVARSSSSLFAAANSAAGTLNLVSHQYDNIHPTTKLRFLQGPFNHILTDALFAQNVTRGVNVSFGLQRLVTDGRYSNSQYDSWNVRTRIRYNISDHVNTWVSDLYTKSITGLNGGIDPINSPSLFDEVTAVVRNKSTVQTLSRHDFTLGLVGRFLPDSGSHTRALAYFSYIDREYAGGTDQFTATTLTDLQHSSFGGATIEQELNAGPFTVEVGVEVERRIVKKDLFLPDVTETYSGAKGLLKFRPLAWLVFDGSARYENLRNDNALSWSATVQTEFEQGLSVRGSMTRSYRYPTLQELYWSDSTLSRNGLPGKETHSAFEIGVAWKRHPFSVSLQAYKRTIDNAIILAQLGSVDAGTNNILMLYPQVDMNGVSGEMSYQLWRLTATARLTYTDYAQQSRSAQPFPRFSSLSELSYSDVFGNHVVDLTIAARLRAMSHHYGLQFVPQQFTFIQQNSSLTPGFSSLDLYAVAKIGDAHVTFVWENPFNVSAMMVPYYPLLGRNVKIGVNWVFAD
jgi:outer membrane cobalamin receptor